MLNLLYLIPALPLGGFLALICTAGRLPRVIIATIGVGSVGVSAALSCMVAISFVSGPPVGHAFSQVLWTWMELPGFAPRVAFHLDPLSLVMVLVVTVVGFLIHLYSVEYMWHDDGFNRFFAYMNLFVASMLTLVLADNLVLLYLGWELVGICSYLLIGFWYREQANANAAIKAFVTTRVGDTAMVVGLFVMFYSLGTLQVQELMAKASEQWQVGSTVAVVAAVLLLGGAVGKSAQLPLQTWLPDAMAGPTPVSALIHAATMVTAGVYLIARTHVIFTLAPVVQTAVAVIGVATLLIAGFSALAQTDIKRVLAYSTISQIGYMFLALGVGAWSAAMFHFVTHAFFKSLLFLGAGGVILAAHHEQNMFRLGGLRRDLPLVFWTFLVGAACLSSLPLVTAGFYSKDAILWYAWSSDKGGIWLWLGGSVGAFVTSVYTFRMVFLTFFGEPRTHVNRRPGVLVGIPLVILAFFSIFAGFVELPHNLGHVRVFSTFLERVLPAANSAAAGAGPETLLQVLSGVLCSSGVLLAYLLFLRGPEHVRVLAETGVGSFLHRLLRSGFGFDRVYDLLVVRPFMWVARVNRNDFVDSLYAAIAVLTDTLHHCLSETQTGRVRQYAFGIAAGAALALWMVVFR
ncbi:MAG: NADH-quinone oxidoreductase subunit L [Thermodesulfobacteriota bacterium]